MSESRKVTLNVPMECMEVLNAFNKATGITLLTVEGTRNPKAIEQLEDLYELIGKRLNCPKWFKQGIGNARYREIGLTIVKMLLTVSPSATADFLINIVMEENDCSEDDAWSLIKDKFLSLEYEKKGNTKQENH